MNCCICLYFPADKPYLNVVSIDGTSLCPHHARDVIDQADYVRFYCDNGLALRETIQALQDLHKKD